MPKISTLLAEHRRSNASSPPYAFEFYPPRTPAGVKKLYERLESMAKLKPLYVDFTWGAGGSTSDLTLQLAIESKKRFGLEPNMHLTCTNMKASLIDEALEGAKAGGIRNIVALRGDPPVGKEDWVATDGGFTCALDLVKHIRDKYGDYFCISVAGYPEGHPTVIKDMVGGKAGLDKLSDGEKSRIVTIEEEVPSKKKDDDAAVVAVPKTVTKYYVCTDKDFASELAYLKQKVDAGADLVITQMFFEAEVFERFVTACRAAGITVPIIPGLMLVQAYGGFTRMTKFCKSRVPTALRAQLEAVKASSKQVKVLGATLGVQMSQTLMAKNICPVLHYYTLNMERVVGEVLKGLKMLPLPEEKKQVAIKATNTHLEGLRANKLSETMENIAVRMQTGTILSQSLDDIAKSATADSAPAIAVDSIKLKVTNNQTESSSGAVSVTPAFSNFIFNK